MVGYEKVFRYLVSRNIGTKFTRIVLLTVTSDLCWPFRIS